MSLRRTLALALFLVTSLPAAARADGLLIPFAGVNFGGDSGDDIGDATDAKSFNWGASLAWMGAGIFGFEGDVGYSPDFYGKNDVGGSSMLSVMGNVLVGVPFGGQQGFGVRPYALVGIGMLKSDLPAFDDQLGNLDNTEVAWNFGGGVMIFFNSHTGIRGDVRYFRTFGGVDFGPIEIAESDAIDFGRASAGFVIRF